MSGGNEAAEFVTVSGAAKVLGYSLWTVYRREKAGLLTACGSIDDGSGAGVRVYRRADVEALRDIESAVTSPTLDGTPIARESAA